MKGAGHQLAENASRRKFMAGEAALFDLGKMERKHLSDALRHFRFPRAGGTVTMLPRHWLVHRTGGHSGRSRLHFNAKAERLPLAHTIVMAASHAVEMQIRTPDA